MKSHQRIDYNNDENQIDLTSSDENSSESEPLIVDTQPSNKLSLKRRIPRYHFRMKHHRILIISSIFIMLLFVHFIIFSNLKINNNNLQVVGWSKNKSRDIADYVLPNENTTLIESNVCNNAENPLLILIIVCSSVHNADARQTIRETWGNVSQFNYPLFDKFHGLHNGSYLNINYNDWRTYAEVRNLCTKKRKD